MLESPRQVVLDGEGQIVAYTNRDGETHSREGIREKLDQLDAEELADGIERANANLERWKRGRREDEDG